MKKNNVFKQEIKEQERVERSKLKSMSFPEKADYIWTYYKAPILISVCVLALIISTVYHFLTNNQESIMYSMVLNANIQEMNSEESNLFDDYLEKRGYDPKKYTVTQNTSMIINPSENGNNTDPQTYAVLAALLMSSTVDNLLTDEETFRFISDAGYIMPLSDYLSEEKISQYESENRIVYGVDPETQKSTAYGIRLDGSQIIGNSPMFTKTPVFGMIYAAPNEETSLDFLDYLLNE